MQNATLDIAQQDTNSSIASMWGKRLLLILIALVVLAAIAYGLKSLLSGGAPHKKAITTIKLLPDTPPPPPPPPPKEPPKEQPKEAPKEVKVEPQPKPVETPPAEQLKMEGAAGDGPSPFAAGTVNDEYKGGEVKTIGKPNTNQFNWYAGLIKNQIEDALARDKKLAVGQYKVVVSVWLKKDGSVEKYELDKTSGDAETDSLIRAALAAMPAMRDAPPNDMPQPVKLRITARSTG